MRRFHPLSRSNDCDRLPRILPHPWLVSDARNDAVLEDRLARLPRGSGLIWRHYHLPSALRRARFAYMRRLAHARGHAIVLAGDPRTARAWGADGVYGSPRALAPRVPGLLRLATVHDAREIAWANRLGVDGVLLSPVFATRSHPGAAPLGPARFATLARLSAAPVIALGGMDTRRARALARLAGTPAIGWAAIDGLS